MSDVAKVVVVGGGFGGVKTALLLAKHPEFNVQLISDNTHFEYHGALYRSAVGHSPMEVVIPLKDIFAKSNVELILDSVGFIDSKKKLLASKTGEIYPYDKAVLALGNTVNYFGVKGLEEHTETMHDITSTITLRNNLVKLFTKRAGLPIRIAVVGAGPSGVELAGELPAFAAYIAREHKLKLPKLTVVLIDGADRVLPMFSPKASAKTLSHLHTLGVEVHLNLQVESCEKGNICLSAGNLGADMIVWTAGSKPVDLYAQNSTIFTLGRGGRVVVDDHLAVTHHKNIYVLGDNADTPFSGMAQTALYDACYIADSFIRELDSKKLKKYKPHKPLYVVTAGPKWAVVEDGKRITTGYRGWRIRRRADLAIFRNFEPYKLAIHTWRQASKRAVI